MSTEHQEHNFRSSEEMTVFIQARIAEQAFQCSEQKVVEGVISVIDYEDEYSMLVSGTPSAVARISHTLILKMLANAPLAMRWRFAFDLLFRPSRFGGIK